MPQIVALLGTVALVVLAPEDGVKRAIVTRIHTRNTWVYY